MITEWTRRTQAATKATATRNGEGWTSRELEQVSTAVETDAEVAKRLGRTLYAVQTVRHAIAAGKAVGSTRQPAMSYRGWVEGMGDGEGLR